MWRHDVHDSPAYQGCGFAAKALLRELQRQYNGKNNGDLTAAYSIMRERGFSSKGTLHSALKELLDRGLIEQTRQGGRNKCSLYALTWEPINECLTKDGKNKLDVKPTTAPSNAWRAKK